MKNTAARKRKQVPEGYVIIGVDPHKKKHAAVAITQDTYSHVLPGLQEAAVERFDEVLALANENSETNVSKMFANREGGECRPYRTRTCDVLIKSQALCQLS